jgi:hypothetical protein
MKEEYIKTLTLEHFSLLLEKKIISELMRRSAEEQYRTGKRVTPSGLIRRFVAEGLKKYENKQA